MLETIVISLLIVAIAIQLGYVLLFFTRILRLPKHTEGNRPQKPVSVVICARNEARNLDRNLQTILAQRYTNEHGKPMYEVIVVNDASEDDTEAVLSRLETAHPHLQHITISKDTERTFKGKKFALSQGIAQAEHELLLFTDADCTPASDRWLELMTAPLAGGKEIAAGYGAHNTRPGALNAFVRWETVHTFLQYASYTMAGMPYMAVGRNLACTKDVFLRAQSSGIWNVLPSGDDDLLMAVCANKDNTAIVADWTAFTYSDAKETPADWCRQKQRHLSTGKYYRPGIKALLGLYALSHFLTWVLFAGALFTPVWLLACGAMLMRCALYWLIFIATAARLGERKLFLWVPLCDMGWALYNAIFSPYIIWKNKQAWK